MRGSRFTGLSTDNPVFGFFFGPRFDGVEVRFDIIVEREAPVKGLLGRRHVVICDNKGLVI